MIAPARAGSAEGPEVLAVRMDQPLPRTTEPHAHARGQLLGALRGLLTVGTDASRWLVPATQAVWIPPHRPHSLQSHGPLFSGWSVYVAERRCADLPQHPCAMRLSGLLREAAARAASWSDRIGALDAAQLRIGEVILDEIRGSQHERIGLPMPTDARLLRICQALGDHLADPRDAAQWARWAGLSARSLSRLFLAQTGCNFNQWRQRARLMRAVEWLAAGRSVTQIAIDLGYGNVSAFIAMFRRHFHTTPSQYARDLQMAHT